jgi:hypothetical protein
MTFDDAMKIVAGLAMCDYDRNRSEKGKPV